jgi:hypothetical protein
MMKIEFIYFAGRDASSDRVVEQLAPLRHASASAAVGFETGRTLDPAVSMALLRG